MRILLVSVAHFCDQPGGGPGIVRDEAAELVRRGEEVWVLAQGSPSSPEHEVLDGVNLLRYVPAKTPAWSPARRSVHQKAAASVLARHLPKVDAVHGHIQLAYLAALDFYGDSVHSCYTVHSPAKMEMEIVWRDAGGLRKFMAPIGLAIINRIEKDCLSRSRTVTALSQYTIDCIAQLHGKAIAESIRLIPGWVDASQYLPVESREQLKAALGWATDRPVFFTLRRLEARMGLDRLLHACGNLVKEGFNFQLVIGGSGSMRSHLETLMNRLGLGTTVRFIGRVDEQQVASAYAACDAFVLPTTALECFGIIALEALSAGRPVLATPVGAIPEIVGKIDPSWLASSAEVPGITDLLRRYLSEEIRQYDPSELHHKIEKEYGSGSQLHELLEAAIGRSNISNKIKVDVGHKTIIPDSV